MIAKPAADEFAPFYTGYIEKVPLSGPLATLEAQRSAIQGLAALPDDKAAHRYAEGKWSVKELLGHVADAERVFGYRLLRIARNDSTPLAGFDENAWALVAPAWLLAGLVALPVAALLAVDRIRSLGHALVDGHLVARSGSVVRRRRVLEVDHVIGWNLRATWFQRRAGLTTLVATTAGGNQAVTVLDVPEDEAVRIAHAALPDLVAQFRA